ncbi:MAG: peptidase C39 [Eubacterium sp.]|nr:peptidase C39 [Eubacterium sp.]
MKSPLRYQATQYDCGPTTITNAIMYLFEREEIPPDLVRHIGQCTLDSYDHEGHCGRYGTSSAAIRYFGVWLNELRYAGLLPIRSSYVNYNDVYFGPGSMVSQALREGAAIVLHVFHDEGHYILLTGETQKGILAFDPYYRGNEVQRKGVIRVDDQPFSHNLIIPGILLNDTGRDYYSMGEIAAREALIIRRDDADEMYMI